MKATYIWQMIKLRYHGTFFFLIFVIFFMAFLCVSQQGEFKIQKHHKKLFGENLCQKLLAEKVEKKQTFFLSSFLFSIEFFLSRFWPFLCMRSPKTDLKISKKSQKKAGR
jgi:hypothetical protein